MDNSDINTMVYLFGFNKNSDPFKYYISHTIPINISKNSIISVSLLHGYSNELPINYTLSDKNIYSIQFHPLSNNNLTYIDVDVDYR